MRERGPVILIALLLLVAIVLHFTGHGVLIWAHRVEPGERYVVGEWGDLGEADQASLDCRYWVGFGVSTRVFWHSPNNILGRDRCPVIIGRDD